MASTTDPGTRERIYEVRSIHEHCPSEGLADPPFASVAAAVKAAAEQESPEKAAAEKAAAPMEATEQFPRSPEKGTAAAPVQRFLSHWLLGQSVSAVGVIFGIVQQELVENLHVLFIDALIL